MSSFGQGSDSCPFGKLQAKISGNVCLWAPRLRHRIDSEISSRGACVSSAEPLLLDRDRTEQPEPASVGAAGSASPIDAWTHPLRSSPSSGIPWRNPGGTREVRVRARPGSRVGPGPVCRANSSGRGRAAARHPGVIVEPDLAAGPLPGVFGRGPALLGDGPDARRLDGDHRRSVHVRHGGRGGGPGRFRLEEREAAGIERPAGWRRAAWSWRPRIDLRGGELFRLHPGRCGA